MQVEVVLHKSLWALIGLVSLIALALSATFLYLDPRVPEISTFSEVNLRVPLRIYSDDGLLVQEFGERLTPITYEEIPPLLEKALLDTEDKRFYDHRGIDVVTLINATWQLLRNRGEIKTGASTITMQLVKNISGETEVRFLRKFKEMLLALKIEREMSKQEILTLYFNMVPFGKHSFGIQAAANTYYGKKVADLDLAQTAMLAGIPQAPEAGNPVNGPERALKRRNLVLQRMHERGSITTAEYEVAARAPITAKVHAREIALPSPHLAEMVRQEILERYGPGAYSQGMVVRTTVESGKQRAAEAALGKKLLEYDRRHGYRGPESRRIKGTDAFLAAPEDGYPANWISVLEDSRTSGGQLPGIVTSVSKDSIRLLTRDLKEMEITRDGLKWARPYLNADSRGPVPESASDIADVGDLVRYRVGEDGSYHLGQGPEIEGALVALDPGDGAILALVGGFDFKIRQFNHVTQARRQPGSIFKPFFYAGAMENGLTAASLYNDAPIVLPGGELGEAYRPKNASGNFYGNMRLREALYRSVNLVSLRVILDYGPANAISYISRFGFDTSNFPKNVQLAFGGGTIALTPLEIATGYAAFANGGYKVTPHLIRTIESGKGDVLWQAEPDVVCRRDCSGPNRADQIIEPRVAHIMNSILSDAINRGTGIKARRALKRGDLHGKTGTTNDADIWFTGYTPDLVATVWAGFSDNRPVGNREWGSTTPLETWIDFMANVLPPESETSVLARPDGIVSVKIDPGTGLRTDPADPDGIFELFREEYVPAEAPAQRNILRDNEVQDIF